MKLKKTLTNTDLYKLAQKYNIEIKVIMKDELNLNNFTNGFYIMNLQNHNQGGTHWTAFVKKGNRVFYSDSFGQYPPENEYQIFNKRKSSDIYVSTNEIQDYNSQLCGWFALSFLLWMQKKCTAKHMLNYYNQFSNITKENDKRLTKIFNSI
jgi:hypothetical protein